MFLALNQVDGGANPLRRTTLNLRKMIGNKITQRIAVAGLGVDTNVALVV